MRIALGFQSITLKMVAFIIVMMPLLTYYDFPGTEISLVTILLIIEAAIMMYCNWKYRAKLFKQEANILSPYIIMTAYIVTITIFASLLGSNGGKLYIMLALILNTINISYMFKLSNNKKELSEYIIKIYIAVCLILCFVTIGEELVYLFSGQVRPMKIEFLPLTAEVEKLGYRFGYNRRGSFVGFSPFFSEPSHMAQYLLPAIVVHLERLKRAPYKSLASLALIEIAITISTSTLGIIVSFMMIIFYVCMGTSEAAMKFRRIVILCLPLLIAVFVYFVRDRLFYEADVSSLLSYTSDKSTYRLYRGFAYYAQFPFLNKIFGVGFNNMTSFVNAHNLSYAYEIVSEDVVSEYLNGISQSLVYGGIIAFVLLIVFFIRLYKYGNSEHRTLVFALAMLMLTAASFLRGMSVFYIFIILALHSKMQNNSELGE